MPEKVGAIRISAPGEGKCPVCATAHDPREPHDPTSLYYQNRFHRKNKRFPLWKDAMAHCSSATQMAWRKKLLAAGVPEEELPDARE